MAAAARFGGSANGGSASSEEELPDGAATHNNLKKDNRLDGSSTEIIGLSKEELPDGAVTHILKKENFPDRSATPNVMSKDFSVPVTSGGIFNDLASPFLSASRNPKRQKIGMSSSTSSAVTPALHAPALIATGLDSNAAHAPPAIAVDPHATEAYVAVSVPALLATSLESDATEAFLAVPSAPSSVVPAPAAPALESHATEAFLAVPSAPSSVVLAPVAPALESHATEAFLAVPSAPSSVVPAPAAPALESHATEAFLAVPSAPPSAVAAPPTPKAIKCARHIKHGKNCPVSCVFRRFFPNEKKKRMELEVLNKAFGTQCIELILKRVPADAEPSQVCDSLLSAAATWTKDPVRGTGGVVDTLRQKLADSLGEAAALREEVADLRHQLAALHIPVGPAGSS